MDNILENYDGTSSLTYLFPHPEKKAAKQGDAHKIERAKGELIGKWSPTTVLDEHSGWVLRACASLRLQIARLRRSWLAGKVTIPGLDLQFVPESRQRVVRLGDLKRLCKVLSEIQQSDPEIEMEDCAGPDENRTLWVKFCKTTQMKNGLWDREILFVIWIRCQEVRRGPYLGFDGAGATKDVPTIITPLMKNGSMNHKSMNKGFKRPKLRIRYPQRAKPSESVGMGIYSLHPPTPPTPMCSKSDPAVAKGTKDDPVDCG